MHVMKAELEAGLDEIARSPCDTGRLEMIVRRPQVGEREVLDVAELDTVDGLVGDTWKHRGSKRSIDGGPHPEMQLNIMNTRVIALVAGAAGTSPAINCSSTWTSAPRICRPAPGLRSAQRSSKSPRSPTPAVRNLWNASGWTP